MSVLEPRYVIEPRERRAEAVLRACSNAAHCWHALSVAVDHEDQICCHCAALRCARGAGSLHGKHRPQQRAWSST